MPSVELFKSLESCCKDLVEWPPLCPVSPGRDVDSEKYAQLLDAVNCLRDVRKYRPTPPGWQSLQPVLVERFEEVGGRFRVAENKYMRMMARKPDGGGLHPRKSSTKGHGNASTVTKPGESCDAVSDLHMTVSGDERETVESRDDDVHTEPTVTAENTRNDADVDDVGADKMKNDSATVEDDAASDVTIVDSSEFLVDSTEEKSSLSVQLPLSVSCAAVSSINTTTDAIVEQNGVKTENIVQDACLGVSAIHLVDLESSVETKNEVVEEEREKCEVNENMIHDACQRVSAINLVDLKLSLQSEKEVVEEDRVKHEVNDISVEQLSDLVDSKLDVDKTLEHEAEAVEVVDNNNVKLDAQPAGDDGVASETAVNEQETSLSLPLSDQNINFADSGQMQCVREDVNTAENSTSFSLRASFSSDDADGIVSLLPVTPDSANVPSFSDCMESSDMLQSHDVADEATDTVNVAQLQQLSPQTSAAYSTSEPPQKMLTETAQEFEACVDDGMKLVVSDDGESNVAEMLVSHSVDSRTLDEHSDSSVGVSKSEIASTDAVQDTASHVGDTVMNSPTVGKPDTSVSPTVKLSGDYADIVLSPCSVPLFRISVSDASLTLPGTPAVNVNSESVQKMSTETGQLKVYLSDVSRSVVGDGRETADGTCKLKRRCSVVLERLSPSLELELPTQSSKPCANEDDNISVITISSSDDDDDDIPLKSANDDVPEPLSSDIECQNAPDPTSASSQQSAHKEMFIMNTEENDGSAAEMELGDRREIVAEAADGCLPDSASTDVNSSVVDSTGVNSSVMDSTGVNSSAIPDAEQDGEIAAGEEGMHRNEAVYDERHDERGDTDESYLLSDETGHDYDFDITICSVDHMGKDDDKQEMPIDDVVASSSAVQDIQLSVAVDENKAYSDELSDESKRTEMPSYPLESADLVSWHPKHPLLNYYSEMVDEIIGDKEASSSSIASENVFLSPGLLPKEDEITPSEDAGTVASEVAVEALVEATDYSLTALDSANVDASAVAGLQEHEENAEFIITEDRRTPCCDIIEPAGDVMDDSPSSLTSTNVPSSDVVISEKNSVVIGDENTICSDVAVPPAADESDSQSTPKSVPVTDQHVCKSSIEPLTSVSATMCTVEDEEDEDEDSEVTVSASEEAMTLCSSVTDAVTAETLASDVLFSPIVAVNSANLHHEVSDGNVAVEDVTTSCSDLTEVMTANAADDRLSVVAAESIPTADDISIVSEDLLEPTGSADASKFATFVSDAQTLQIEQLGSPCEADELILCDENNDGNVVVCDPFPIFAECRTCSDSVDNLTESSMLHDSAEVFPGHQSTDRCANVYAEEIEKDICTLISQLDVPEPSDEIYLCTTVASTQSSSEEQSEVDCEDDRDTYFKNQVTAKSTTDTASELDLNVGDEVVSSNIPQPLCSYSVTAADDSIGLNSEQVADTHGDTKGLDTASASVADTAVDAVNSELSNVADVCTSQESGSFQVQKGSEEFEAKEQLEHSEVDSAEPVVLEENLVTVKHDVSAAELDICGEEQQLSASPENAQEMDQEVTGENKTVSSMLDKLGALCRNVSYQKVQSQSSESTTDVSVTYPASCISHETVPVTEQPVYKSSVEPIASVSSSMLNTSPRCNRYCCPECQLTFCAYTDFLHHLRAENARRNSDKSTNVDSGSGKESTTEMEKSESVKIDANTSSSGKKPRRRASSTASRSRKPTEQRGSASQEMQSDVVGSPHPLPAKSRRSLPKSSAASASKSQKRSLFASQGSNSMAASQTKSETAESSLPIPSKSRRRSLPKSFQKDSPSASIVKSNKRKSSMPENATKSLDHRATNQQSQHGKLESSQPAVDKTRRSLPKALATAGRSKKPPAPKGSDSSAGVQQGNQDTEKSSHSTPSKSRRRPSKSVCQDSGSASTGGSQKSARQSSNSNVESQQMKENTNQSSSSKSRRSLPKTVCEDGAASKPKSRSRRSLPCAESDKTKAKTPAARKRLSSVSCAHEAKSKKNKP